MRNEGGMGKGRVLLDTGDNMVLKVGVMVCKLICKGRKYMLELPLLKVVL